MFVLCMTKSLMIPNDVAFATMIIDEISSYADKTKNRLPSEMTGNIKSFFSFKSLLNNIQFTLCKISNFEVIFMAPSNLIFGEQQPNLQI